MNQPNTSTTDLSAEKPMTNETWSILSSLFDALAFPLLHRQGPISVNNQEFQLLRACSKTVHLKNNSDLKVLLEDPMFLSLILNSRHWPTYHGSQPKLLLNLLLFVAVSAQNHFAFGLLMDIASQHKIVHSSSIDRVMVSACGNGDFTICKTLLDTYPECIHAESIYALPELAMQWIPDGEDPPKDSCKLLELLLSRGADPNQARRPFRWTHGCILQQAAFKKSTVALNLLLYYGAKVKQSGAFQAAAVVNWVEGLEILLQHGADVNEKLSERVHTDGTRQLLSRGTDSPIFYAVRRNCKEALIWLLEHGADPAFENSGGERAEDVASRAGYKSLHAILRKYRKELNLIKNGLAEYLEGISKNGSQDCDEVESGSENDSEESFDESSEKSLEEEDAEFGATNDCEDQSENDGENVEEDETEVDSTSELEKLVGVGSSNDLEDDCDQESDEGPPRKRVRLN